MNDSYRFALLGQAISYSKSPELFGAIAAQSKSTIAFDIRSIDPSEFPAQVQLLKEEQYEGFALTIPYKQQIIPLLDTVSAEAATIKAVNCVRLKGEKLEGHNTDWKAFATPLLTLRNHLESAHVLIFGTGGAARSVAYALDQYALANRITFFGRNISRHVSELSHVSGRVPVTTIDSAVPQALLHEQFDLIVNCTPLGGWNYPDDTPLPSTLTLSPETIYYDLNYNRPNRVAESARSLGCLTIDGAPMLIAQGIEAFQIWTGRDVPFQPIYHAVFAGDDVE
jgi:shikimate dehydrogenase